MTSTSTFERRPLQDEGIRNLISPHVTSLFFSSPRNSFSLLRYGAVSSPPHDGPEGRFEGFLAFLPEENPYFLLPVSILVSPIRRLPTRSLTSYRSSGYEVGGCALLFLLETSSSYSLPHPSLCFGTPALRQPRVSDVKPAVPRFSFRVDVPFAPSEAGIRKVSRQPLTLFPPLLGWIPPESRPTNRFLYPSSFVRGHLRP